MMIKIFSSLVLGCLSLWCYGQHNLFGKVYASETGLPLVRAEVYDYPSGQFAHTDSNGNYTLTGLNEKKHRLTIYAQGYQIVEIPYLLTQDTFFQTALPALGQALDEVVVSEYNRRLAPLKHLRQVEGTSIYAGKKNEVIQMSALVGNLASNKARQIYSQIASLNIYEGDDAGIQLNIGGRGLDPNRTQNFNTRQNGYDISADVLGYPESYYTPPAEALKSIQIIRGAASLQYGTQFGGMLNFVFKDAPKDKKIALVSRQSLGSYGLFTSFNSLAGTVGKFDYSTFFHHKQGTGFRPNSEYSSHNVFARIGWTFNAKTDLHFEYTYLGYLAHQPGGLTDKMFYENPTLSNRSRNWFQVNWNLFALKFRHQFNPQTHFSLNLFGLNASRQALGFRENRVSQQDRLTNPRDLLSDNFNNIGVETRLLKRYTIARTPAVFLIGAKYYQAYNEQQQGPGSGDDRPNFKMATTTFTAYPRQAQFQFPNTNVALFSEHIFRPLPRLSITPGIRWEYIKTESRGSYRHIVLDLADHPILDESIDDNRTLERNFLLFGIGLEYQFLDVATGYANISQNYRSVTFSDMRVVNPVLQIDPNISDEKGFTSDVGIRGNYRNLVSFDVGVFGLMYARRIGEILKPETRLEPNGVARETGRIIRYRSNIGDALIYGLETMIDWDVKHTFDRSSLHYKINLFTNLSLTKSTYIRSEQVGVSGNTVEFIPLVNLKTGLNVGYKNLMLSFQYSYLSEQFSDASNTPQQKTDNQRGIEGSIPAYDVADLSLSYTFRRYVKLEGGINNLFNASYFTRRATGYPGPGIIPAQPLTWYLTLQVSL